MADTVTVYEAKHLRADDAEPTPALADAVAARAATGSTHARAAADSTHAEEATV